MQPSPFAPAPQLGGSVNDRRGNFEQLLSLVVEDFYACIGDKNKSAEVKFRGHARSRSVGGFTIARFITTGGSCRLSRRDAEIARDGRDHYILHMLLRGKVGISQFGRNQLIEPRSYTLISAADPVSHDNIGEDDAVCLVLPREFVEQRVVSGERLCARPHQAGTGFHKLVFETANTFQRNAWDINNDEFCKAAHAVADLMLLALSGSVDLLSGERAVRAGNLARAKRIIRRRLTDPDLTLTAVAREADLSLGHLHALFREEGEGLTMREYLQSERLQRARTFLSPSSLRKRTVTEVALECGFSNVSYFSTVFKKAFGISPRDALREH